MIRWGFLIIAIAISMIALSTASVERSYSESFTFTNIYSLNVNPLEIRPTLELNSNASVVVNVTHEGITRSYKLPVSLNLSPGNYTVLVVSRNASRVLVNVTNDCKQTRQILVNESVNVEGIFSFNGVNLVTLPNYWLFGGILVLVVGSVIELKRALK
ncbi:hypothetical protein HS7_11240 [Sulfolobales archaeon HS-7]|nr:hypothetical protein HS7_11240 [Sulfolobales archaeon HS-7]